MTSEALSPRAARTRTALLEAGLDLLADRPIDAIAIDELVAAAGVAKGSFFNHFGDKYGFANAIGEAIRSDIEALIGALNADERDPLARLCGGMIGAAHAIDIPFVFDILEDHRLHVFVGADAPRSLARATNEAWIAFASTGVPAADGLAEWPTIDSEATRPVMVLDTEPSLADDPNGDTRRFWDATGSAMPASAD